MGCIYFETVLNDFFLQISSDTKYFSSLIQDIVIEDYTIFKLEIKKEHNIIISRVISSHMGPMYIETPNTRLQTVYTCVQR